MENVTKFAKMFAVFAIAIAIAMSSVSYNLSKTKVELEAYKSALRNAEDQLHRQEVYLKVYRDKYKQEQ